MKKLGEENLPRERKKKIKTKRTKRRNDKAETLKVAKFISSKMVKNKV